MYLHVRPTAAEKACARCACAAARVDAERIPAAGLA